jgi:hypothetical protein
MRAAGVPVAVSTDGPASNDNLDVLEEARLALLFARLRDGDAAALGVSDALHMITREPPPPSGGTIWDRWRRGEPPMSSGSTWIGRSTNRFDPPPMSSACWCGRVRVGT